MNLTPHPHFRSGVKRLRITIYQIGLKNRINMGIAIEFNPDLALRSHSQYKLKFRKKEECLPEVLVENKIYDFLKGGQRNYWLDGELPLLETKGNQELSRPIASIIILEVIHFKEKDEIWTKGKYKVIEVFKDNKIKFESYARVGKRFKNKKDSK